MGEIRGVGLLEGDEHNAGRRARALARLAVRAGVPADIVNFSEPLRDLSATSARGPSGESIARVVVAQATATEQGRDKLAPMLVDEFRWRAWVAHAMGATFIVCPDVPAERGETLAAMGLRILGPADELPSLAEVAGAQVLRPVGETSLPSGISAVDEQDSLDHQLRLRALRARAGEVVTGSFQAGSHEVGAVVADKNGTLWFGLGMSSGNDPALVCAEAVAVGNAVMGGAADLAYVAAVRHPRARPRQGGYRLVTPCPSCRSLLLGTGQPVRVVVETAAGLEALTLDPSF